MTSERHRPRRHDCLYSAAEERPLARSAIRQAQFRAADRGFAQIVSGARYGVLPSGWDTRRLNELARLTGGVRVPAVDGETIERVAQLRDECRLIGAAPEW